MTSRTKQLANEALSLSPKERATLADTLLISLDRPDPKIDALWKMEAESRLRAYKSGKLKAIPLSKVLINYRKKKAA
jgi:putative addiction module component (TIGR02574 family)